MAKQSCSLVIIGDGSVGKSTIINSFKTEGFQPIYKQTIGCDFYERQLKVRSDVISLRVWDIGGQSFNSKNLSSYVGHADSVMLVYDVTNRESFDNLNDWLQKTKEFNKTKFIYLIGNKVDLLSVRQVSPMQHEEFIIQNSLRGGNFCSAKTGENVVKMFYRISGEISGVNLTEYELAFYDKVLTAHITKDTSDGDDEARNEWAEAIEREDLELERKKQSKIETKACYIS